METYIHIGLPKTGTTSLQGFFRSNRKALSNRGVVYPATTGSAMLEAADALLDPSEFSDVEEFRATLRRFWKKHDLSNVGNGTPSAFALLSESPAIRASNPKYVSPRLDFKTCWRELNQQAEPGKALLVSSEELAAIPARELHHRAAFDGRKKRIIVYLRQQDFAIEATYSQAVRTGLFTGTIDEYVDDVLLNRNRARGIFDYRTLVSDCWQAFGREHVHVFLFEEDCGPEWIFTTALRALGLRLDTDFDLPERSNASLHPLFVEYLRRSLIAGTWSWPLVRQVNQLTSDPAFSTGIPSGLLAPESRARVRGHFADGNRWLASELIGEPCALFISDAYPDQFVASEYDGYFQLLDEATASVGARK